MRHHLDDDSVVRDGVDIVGHADHKGVAARSAETHIRGGGVRIG